MNKSTELFNKLDLFQQEIRIEYDKAISKLKENVIFCEDELVTKGKFIVSHFDEEKLNTCTIVDITDEINGGIYSVYVTVIFTNGMFYGVDLNDSSNQDRYTLSDIANEYNKIELIQLLELYND